MFKFFFSLLAIFLFLFANCHSLTKFSSTKGNVKGGRYYSKVGGFSFRYPLLDEKGCQAKERNQDGYTSVVFTDDFGEYIQWDVTKIPNDDLLVQIQNLDPKKNIIEILYQEAIEPQIKNIYPNVKTITENLISHNGKDCYFAILNGPMSSLIDRAKNQPSNANMGILCTIIGDLQVTIITQDRTSMLGYGDRHPQTLEERLKEKLFLQIDSFEGKTASTR